MTKHSTWMLALTGLIGSACAGNLEDPARFEKGFNSADDADGGTNGTGGETAGNGDTGTGNAGNGGNGGNTGAANDGNGGFDGGAGNNATGGTGNGSDTGGSDTGSDGTGGGTTGNGGGNTGSTGAPQPACDVAPIFKAKCSNAGCHGSAGPAAGLDLASPNLAARVRDKTSTCDDYQLVDTAAPENSFIFLKVSESKPPCGARMPFGVVLTADEQACILDWAESL